MFTKSFQHLSKKDVGIAGGKGASLGELTRAGIPVPSGFVVLAAAFERFLKETDLNVEIEAQLHKVNHQDVNSVERVSEDIRELILEAAIPKDIATEISRRMAAMPTPDGVVFPTVSYGVTSSIPASADLNFMIEVADAALYSAKAQGRNRIVGADRPEAATIADEARS